MNDAIIARASEIIRQKMGGGNEGYCVLALIGPDGYPRRVHHIDLQGGRHQVADLLHGRREG